MKGRSASLSMLAFSYMYTVDNGGRTPLHLGCIDRELEVAEYLLDHNAGSSIRGGSFILVSWRLLMWKVQIIGEGLPFNLPKGGRSIVWLICLRRGVSENEILCD